VRALRGTDAHTEAEDGMNKEMENMGSSSFSLLTVKDAAGCLQVSTRMIRKLLTERQLAFVKVGRRTRIDPEDIRAYVHARKVRPGSRATVA
jgi:excisionase family DNA binding protein